MSKKQTKKVKKVNKKAAKPGKLILARHHESEWNKLGKWTGLRDIHLSPHGLQKAKDMGLLIKDMNIDYAFASMKVRTIETLSCILNTCEIHNVPTEHREELNERDYGDYTGMNKWDVQKSVGDEEFKKIRRHFDHPIPNGESLKMVYKRAVPFFLKKILPMVNRGKNVIVVAHGNSLRSIMKYIEKISDEAIADLELGFGELVIYELDKKGRMKHKEIRLEDPNVNLIK